MNLLLGDCLDKLKELEDNSVDSIVTDPPYGLSFMAKKWDYDVPSTEVWDECMRVLKPGGYLLSFAGSRTYHRMAVRIEDAGFEIRDQIMWVYGSGFPKSQNVGNKLGEEYKGIGTALKPAHEPIVMARKPLSEKTVVDNVLEWGTGGINIDDSRIEYSADDHVMKYEGYSNGEYKSKYENGTSYKHGTQVQINPEGRFPANIIFDEEAGKILDEQSGISKSTGGRIEKKTGWGEFGGSGQKEIIEGQPGFGDVGGASRFFYCPKTSKSERNEGTDNNHPTVKPTDLMLYLIRLVTPKGGITLDPFMGSGSTGKGAIRGGFDFIGIEREEEYFQIAERRINYEINNPYKKEGKKVEVKTEVVEKVNKFFS